MEDLIKELEKRVELLTKEQHDMLMEDKRISEEINRYKAQIDTLKRENIINIYQSMVGKYYSRVRGDESFKSHTYFYVKNVVIGDEVYLKGHLIKWCTQDGKITNFSYITDTCLPPYMSIKDFVETSCHMFYVSMVFFDSIQ